MESITSLEQLWSHILAVDGDDPRHSESHAARIANNYYGKELHIVLKYLREKLFSHNWSSTGSLDRGVHSMSIALRNIIRYSRSTCSSRAFIYSHHCKELLVTLLDFGAEGAPSDYGDRLLHPIYHQLCAFRKMHGPSTLNRGNEQEFSWELGDNCTAVVPIRDVLLLYNELSPSHKREVQEQVERALLFDIDIYLLDFERFVSAQLLEAPLDCNTIEFLYHLSVFEEKILYVLQQTLPAESNFDPVQTLARACNATVCLSLQLRPEQYRKDLEIIVHKLLKEEMLLCNKIVSFMDHTILAFMLNKHYGDLVEIMSNIVCSGISTIDNMESIFKSLFIVDVLTSHTGAYHAKLLSAIHNRLLDAINSEDCYLKEQIGLYAAAFINFYHIARKTDTLKKILPHSPLFACELFDKQVLLDLFSRMTALRLELTLVDENADKLSYIMAELELFDLLTSISTQEFSQMYTYVLIVSTGCKEAYQIETKSKMIYNVRVTSEWRNSMPKMAEMIAGLIQPITLKKVDIGLSSARLPKNVRTAICGARFAIVDMGLEGGLRAIREDCIQKISQRLQNTINIDKTTDCLNQRIHSNCFYIPVAPKDINFTLNATHLSEKKDENIEHRVATGMQCKESVRLYIMAYMSRTVKVSGAISIESLVNTCYEHCQTNAVTKNDILSAIQHLIECDILECTGEATVRWSA